MDKRLASLEDAPLGYASRDGAPNAVDTQLVARMACGDERAVSELYDMHSPRLFGLAVAMMRERADAEEVLLDAFTQAWRTAERFDATRGTVLSWLTTILRSRAIDLIRARTRRAWAHQDAGRQAVIDVGIGTYGSSLPNVGTLAIESDALGSELARAMLTLPEPQREVIALAFFGGSSYSRIAKRLGVPLGTVKTRARLALRRMRAELATGARI